MPYMLKKVNNGYKVCDASRCFSKNPMPKEHAMKQRIAIALSEHKKQPNKPINYFFK